VKMTIGTVARLAGVGVETVRFYERKGLIEGPPQHQSGYREYPPEVVKRIRFIRRAKEVGFSLKEIHSLLALRLEPGTTCSDVRRQAQAKIMEIEGRIADLSRMQQALIQIAGLCAGDGPLSACPILDALEMDSSSERATE
jgi:MerR family transcriptional regulator, copper efflux regulator